MAARLSQPDKSSYTSQPVELLAAWDGWSELSQSNEVPPRAFQYQLGFQGHFFIEAFAERSSRDGDCTAIEPSELV